MWQNYRTVVIVSCIGSVVIRCYTQKEHEKHLAKLQEYIRSVTLFCVVFRILKFIMLRTEVVVLRIGRQSLHFQFHSLSANSQVPPQPQPAWRLRTSETVTVWGTGRGAGGTRDQGV